MAAIATKSEMHENSTNEKSTRIMQSFLLKIMTSIQNMQNFLKTHALLRKILPFITIFVITGLVTIFFFSNLYLSYSSKNYAEKQLALVNASIPDSSSYNAQTGKKETKDQAHIVGNTINIPTSGSDVILSDINSATKAIKIELEQTKPVTLVTGTVEIEDFGIAPNAYTLADSFQMSTGKHNTRTLRFESHGDAYKVRLHFNQTGAPFTLKAVTVNPPFALHINFGMWAILFVASSLIFLVYKKKWYLLNYDRHNLAQNIVFWAVCAMLMGFSLYLCFVVYHGHGIRVPFPSDLYDRVNGNPYTEQLKAWKSNSLALLQQPPKELVESANPFSWGQRMDLGSKGVSIPWDVVFHNNHYYCYFGIVPFLLTYLPFNLLFPHAVPSAILVVTIFAVAIIPSMFALLREVVEFFAIRANYCLFLLSAAAFPFGCLIFYLQSSASLYYMPLLSAILFGILFVYASLKAVRLHATHPRAGYALFALAGISLALQCGSRPNACIPVVAFIAPLFIALLFDAKRSIANRVAAASSFLVPAIVGVAGILAYNYLRFKSFFNFGNEEQLTNFDLRFNSKSFDPTKIRDIFLNYFLKPFNISENFPYISIPWANNQGYGNSFYTHMIFGLMMIPLFWWLFTLRRKFMQKIEYIMTVVGLVASFLLLYLNYCLGGNLYRYYCDSIIIFILIAIMSMLHRVKPYSKDIDITCEKDCAIAEQSSLRLYIPAVLCAAVTIVIVGLLVFSNHTEPSADIQNVNPDLFLKWSDLFTIGR
ncbi:hypothetical protein CYJ61_00260 [Gardnerella leopoldii]|uniref:Uncharacterized protein n=2 Tax=Bifidobacteriaceae TaxID=31953 RepID=A0AAP8ITJ0_GARVA|nr:hypothetical protein CYJ61_00260 [Gardnerella vaginalis]